MRFGRYDLIERIGSGGMAEVFLAVRRGPRGVAKRLVIKRIAPARAADPRFVSLFEQEARVGCELSHGNLVSVFEFGRVGDHWFIAMEHVDGCDLGAALAAVRARGVPIDPAIAARVGAEVCRGLAHVHAHGWVHRDVTPRNVLVSWDGQVKLSDFGVALASARLDDVVRGTPRYMAPEHAGGGLVDARADLYSLGAVLAHAGGEGALGPIIARATAHDPADRYASADEMRAALVKIARGADERAVADALASVKDSIPWREGMRTRARSEDGATPDTVPLAAHWRRPPRTLDPTTAATATGAPPDPLASLDALLAPPRGRRTRAWLAPIGVVSALALALAARGSGRAPAAAPLPAACTYGEGYYCGSTLRGLDPGARARFDDDTLYTCTGERAIAHEVCEYGCWMAPPGQADVCRVSPARPEPARSPDIRASR
jgi:hypothetical protein